MYVELDGLLMTKLCKPWCL